MASAASYTLDHFFRAFDSVMTVRWIFFWGGLLLCAGPVLAQTGASVPYTPSCSALHQLQLLSDLADLPLTTSHWPSPRWVGWMHKSAAW